MPVNLNPETTQARSMSGPDNSVLYYRDPIARERLAELKTDAGLRKALGSGTTLRLTLSPPASSNQQFYQSLSSSPPQMGAGGDLTSTSPTGGFGRSLVSRLKMNTKQTTKPEIITSADLEDDVSSMSSGSEERTRVQTQTI